MKETRNLPAPRADPFESAGKVYGNTKCNGSGGASFVGGCAAGAI